MANQFSPSVSVMTGDSGSGGTAGLAPAPAAGDAAAGKFLKANATWATVPAGFTAVNARYGSTSSTLTGSQSTIVWDDKIFDTNNAMSSGTYTIPAAGVYAIGFTVSVNGTFSSQNIIANLKNNGTRFAQFEVVTSLAANSCSVSDIVTCATNDAITASCASSATGPSYISNDATCFFWLYRIA